MTVNYAQQLTENLQQIIPQASISENHLPDNHPLKLYLLDPQFNHISYSAEESQRIMDTPPYWCFCWASGQVLSRYIIENKSMFAGKTVLDFGAGSGVCAVAAAMAGAKVYACDNDPHAIMATEANAALNDVALTTINDLDLLQSPVDIILAADVLYDKENLPLLSRFAEMAKTVIIADSRVKNLNEPPYQAFDEYSATTFPDYGEFDEFKQVKLYHLHE